MKKTIIISSILLLLSLSLWGGNKCILAPTTTAPVWTDTANWVNGVMPTSGNGDTLVISNTLAGVTVTIPEEGIILSALDIRGTKSITLSGGDITLKGNFFLFRYATINANIIFDKPNTELRYYNGMSEASNAGGTTIVNGTTTFTDNTIVRVGGWSAFKFYGIITGLKGTLKQAGSTFNYDGKDYSLNFCTGGVYFYASVRVKNLSYDTYGKSFFHFCTTGNEWTTANIMYNAIYFDCENACATNGTLNWSSSYIDPNCEATTTYYLNGHNQIANRINSGPNKYNGSYFPTAFNITTGDSKPCTFTLRGLNGATNYCRLTGPISLVWAPINNTYEQAFLNRDHTTSGKLVSSNGTLRIGGTCTFKNVTTLEAAGGTIRLNTTTTNALEKVKQITLTNGGKVTLESGQPLTAGFDSEMCITAETGTTLEIAEGTTMSAFRVHWNGGYLEPGVYTGADNTLEGATAHPFLSGKGTLRVLSKFVPTTNTYTWKGNSGGFSNPANWDKNDVPGTGDTVVLSATSTGAFITNDLPNVSLNKITCSGTNGFTLGGSALKVLHLENNVTSGTITNACGVVFDDLSICYEKTISNAKTIHTGGFSGAGKLFIKGTGRHVFAAASSLSIGTEVQDGGTIVFDDAHGLGTDGSTITVTAATPNFVLNVPNVTYNYSFVPNASMSFTTPKNCTIGGSLKTDKSITLYMYVSKEGWTAQRATGGQTVHMTATVDMPKGTILNQCSGSSMGMSYMYYDTAMTLGTFQMAGASTTWGSGQAHLTKSGGHITKLQHGFGNVYLDAADALGADVLIDSVGYSDTQDSLLGQLYLGGFATYARALVSSGNFATSYCGKNGLQYNTSKASTLFVNLNQSLASTYAVFKGPLSIVLNAQSETYVQAFTNRTSRLNEMTGALIASNGILRIETASSFASVPRLAADGKGRIEVKTTKQGALAGVRTIDLTNGGTLVLDEAAADAFDLSATGWTINLSSDATLTLPENMTLKVDHLYVDGVRQENNTTFGASGTALSPLKSGTLVTCDAESTESVSATWDAGASDEKLSSAANWAGDQVPKLQNREVVATFATAGTRTEVDTLARFKGVILQATACANEETLKSFTFDATASGTGDLRIGSEGLKTSAGIRDLAAQQFAFNTPVKLEMAQTWDCGGSNVTINVNAPLASDADQTLSKIGFGTLNINTTNALQGRWTISRGTVNFNAPSNNLGQGTSLVKVYENVDGSKAEYGMNDGASVHFNGTIEERPFDYCNASYLYVNDGRHRLTFQGTNVFNGKFSTSNSDGNFTIYNNSRLELNGGSSFAYQTVYGDGENAELVFNSPAKGSYFIANGNGLKIHFNAQNNAFSQQITFQSRNISAFMGCDWVFNDTTKTSIGIYKDLQWNGVIDLQGHVQRMGYWPNAYSGTTGSFTSAQPTTLYFLGGGRTNTYLNVTGCLSLNKENAKAFTLNRALSTHGDLTVSAGAFNFTRKGSFPNGTNVTVCAGATLHVAASSTFGRQAIIHLDTTGTLDLEESSYNHVEELYVNGARMPAGLYGASTSSARHKLTNITGTGLLRVGVTGTALFIR